jgi:hypothetical protein
MKATRRIAVRTYWLGSPQFLGSEVIEMVPLKVEETLHDYLRRHFEKVSKGNARQFAEQKEVTKVDHVPDKLPADGNES